MSARDELKLTQQIKVLQQWVDDLQSGMFINCVYCGHRYGPSESIQPSMQDVLKEHVEKCPQHPMSALKRENARLLDAIEEAVPLLLNPQDIKAYKVINARRILERALKGEK